jgi:hypothetical protein
MRCKHETTLIDCELPKTYTKALRCTVKSPLLVEFY